MNKKFILALVILVTLFAIWKLWLSGPSIPADSKDTLNEEKDAPTTVYTLADLAKHAGGKDCWIANGGTVYNATAFVASDAGRALAPACGTDATVAFAKLPVSAMDGPQTIVDPPVRIGDLAQ